MGSVIAIPSRTGGYMHSYGDDDWVTIASFGTVFDAQICCGLLRDNGVDAVVADESVGAMFSIAVGGAKVRVRKSDEEFAINVLESGMEED